MLGLGTARGGRLPCKQEKQVGSIPTSSIHSFSVYKSNILLKVLFQREYLKGHKIGTER